MGPPGTVSAVGGVRLTVRKGETYGPVGESGRGTTMPGRVVAGLSRAERLAQRTKRGYQEGLVAELPGAVGPPRGALRCVAARSPRACATVEPPVTTPNGTGHWGTCHVPPTAPRLASVV
ncbi:hypothetical protein GCM10018785_04340 [Streptomyces longispororuber]|uniref:Uncharacterized protein n=1 Tax=Streptomyces longispororuber TaxID=68230 RepID=A0A918Z6G7_9ACTN|nr:hypothetical protein GCM10018785_04340 [Streptomyces longispororuber]